MPKIEFIRNINNELIYPKTHEDAIVTIDGYKLSQKFDSINESLRNKSESDHKHYYSELLEKPDAFKADGGNADTIQGKNVDDTKTTVNNLWTSKKIDTELQLLKQQISNANESIYTGVSAPENNNAVIWINPADGTVKHKTASGIWENINSSITFQYD